MKGAQKPSLDPKATIYYVQAPLTLLVRHEELGLKWQDVLLWALLRRHGGLDGECFPSEETLAREMGTSLDTVQRGLKRLIAAALLETIRGRRQPQSYRLLEHPVTADLLLADRRNQETAAVRLQEAPDTADSRHEIAKRNGQETANLTYAYTEEKRSPEKIFKTNQETEFSSSSSSTYEHQAHVSNRASDEDDDGDAELQPIKTAIGQFTSCGAKGAREVLRTARRYDPEIPAGAVALLVLASVPEGYQVRHAGYFSGAVK